MGAMGSIQRRDFATQRTQRVWDDKVCFDLPRFADFFFLFLTNSRDSETGGRVGFTQSMALIFAFATVFILKGMDTSSSIFLKKKKENTAQNHLPL